MTFDHLEQGTSETSWQEAAALTSLARLEPPGHGARLLVIAAHPDDESLGAGGLIAAAAARGSAVDVLIATDGEASHPRSSSHSPGSLARIRRGEAAAALTALASSAGVSFLGLPDGNLRASCDGLAGEIATRIAECTHVLSPWSGDRHPDHEACATAVRVVVDGRPDIAHWQYPIWAWHWADPHSSDLPWDVLRRFDLDSQSMLAKRAALACYRSQLLPLSPASGDEAVLAPHILAHFNRDFEVFVQEVRRPATEERYFDALYAAAEDPWGLAERFYERRKRDLLLASLPKARFRRAFEPGCATGLLTARLAERCDEVIAWDGAAAAVRQASARVASCDWVRVEQRRIPSAWPVGEFDLVVLSEVGYYCEDLARLATKAWDCLSNDGVVVACHWRHAAADHPHIAEEVHDAIAASGLRPLVQHRETDFLLDVWTRTGESVARAEGVVG